MYSRALLRRSFYVDTAFWARRYYAHSRNMCNLRFFAVRQRPMTPVLPRSLPRIMLRQILSCEPAPPILKGASPLLHRWASSVGTDPDIYDCARAIHKVQPGRWWWPPRKYPYGPGLGYRGRAQFGFLGRPLVLDLLAGCQLLHLQLRMPYSSVCEIEC